MIIIHERPGTIVERFLQEGERAYMLKILNLLEKILEKRSPTNGNGSLVGTLTNLG